MHDAAADDVGPVVVGALVLVGRSVGGRRDTECMTEDDAAAMLDAMMPTEAEVLALLAETRLQLADVLDALADAAADRAELAAMLDAVNRDEATGGYAEATLRPRLNSPTP